jgi:deazaflavin-dependent oxidoreductase (nitroreductase family)
MPKPPPRWIVRANSAALGLGLAIGAQYLLTVPGRRSGRPRQTPVSIVTHEGSRYIVAAFAEADWVRNLRAAGSGTLTRRRAVEAVRFAEVAADQRGPILRAFLTQVPGGRRFFEPAESEAVVTSADRYPVFEVIAVP